MILTKMEQNTGPVGFDPPRLTLKFTMTYTDINQNIVHIVPINITYLQITIKIYKLTKRCFGSII